MTAGRILHEDAETAPEPRAAGRGRSGHRAGGPSGVKGRPGTWKASAPAGGSAGALPGGVSVRGTEPGDIGLAAKLPAWNPEEDRN